MSLLVFSTYVEVILRQLSQKHLLISVLHVCGGDPSIYGYASLNTECSPRMWRWSPAWHTSTLILWVFSTYVEVILPSFKLGLSDTGVLHVCGGDPNTHVLIPQRIKCSPRMWRWSRPNARRLHERAVFSTYVEVILDCISPESKQQCVLHVCGGDPIAVSAVALEIVCSPRMWRWSCWFSFKTCAISVFSTYVEVILV